MNFYCCREGEPFLTVLATEINFVKRQLTFVLTLYSSQASAFRFSFNAEKNLKYSRKIVETISIYFSRYVHKVYYILFVYWLVNV